MSSPSDQRTLTAAVAAHRAGRLTEAERVYREVIAEEPRNPQALHLLGVLRGQLGDFAEGIGLIRGSLKLNPKSVNANADLGELLRRAGDLDGAGRAFLAALALDPRPRGGAPQPGNDPAG